MKKVYTIYDKKALSYSPMLMVFDNRVSALRQFEQLCRSDGTLVNRYPDDFALYCLGNFDEEKGKLISYDVPEHILDASEYIIADLSKQQDMKKKMGYVPSFFEMLPAAGV